MVDELGVTKGNGCIGIRWNLGKKRGYLAALVERCEKNMYGYAMEFLFPSLADSFSS